MEKLAVLLSSYVESQSRRGYVDTSKGQIHYRTVGQGRPIVLLHQTPSSSAMWERFMKSFPSGYQLIALDSPGFGNSDAPTGPIPMAGYAATLLEALTALGIKEALFMGHHTGASIAIEIACQAPERVQGLVLMGPFAPPTALQLHWWKNLVHRWQPDNTGEFVTEAVLPRLNMVTGSSDAQHYLSELVGYLQAGPNYWWAYDAVFSYDTAANAAKVKAPTLILTGAHEVPDQADMGRHVHAIIKGSEYATISGGSSEMVSEIPAALHEVVLPFIAKIKGGK
ncbi:MAG: alpha/beta hydrolase [Actinomycetes bacterium]